MTTGDQLLAAIYAEPADDEPRMVYADWLLEQGNPRGELIVVQIRARGRELTEAEQRRIRDLVKPGLGSLVDVVEHKSARFDRGFLVEATTRITPKLLATADDPAWQLVEVLRGDNKHTPRLLGRAPLRALRIADCMLWNTNLRGAVVANAGTLAALEQIYVFSSRGYYRQLDAELAAFIALPSLVELRLGVDLEIDELRAVLANPLAQRLSRLVIGSFRAFELRDALVGEAGPVSEIAFENDRGERSTLRRDTDGRYVLAAHEVIASTLP